MAWTDVECNECGTTYRVQMYGKMKDREWKVENWKGYCQECKDKFSREQLEQAQKESEEMGLPELTGTEKQIAWATKIRAEMVANQEHLSAEESVVLDIIIQKRLSAGWWIDHRDNSDFRNAIKKAAEYTTPSNDAERSAQQQADIDATVYPEKPVTNCVTEIKITEDIISAILSEKNEDFRQIVRFGLGYSWSGSAWERKIGSFAGKIEDRAAELGHKLLSNGFPLRIHREDIRMSAIFGQYEPEQTRWIINLDKGVGIRWGKKEDLYQEAKKLRGAKYNRDCRAVEVSPENFEEILDFAGVHCFSVSDKAAEKLNTAREARDGALRIKVEPVREPKKTTAKQQELKVPETVEVDDDLRDDD